MFERILSEQPLHPSLPQQTGNAPHCFPPVWIGLSGPLPWSGEDLVLGSWARLDGVLELCDVVVKAWARPGGSSIRRGLDMNLVRAPVEQEDWLPLWCPTPPLSLGWSPRTWPEREI